MTDQGPWIKTDDVGYRLLRGAEVVSIFYQQEDDERYRVGCLTRTPVRTTQRGSQFEKNPHEVWLCYTPDGRKTVSDLALAIALTSSTDMITFHPHADEVHVRMTPLLPKPAAKDEG